MAMNNGINRLLTNTKTHRKFSGLEATSIEFFYFCYLLICEFGFAMLGATCSVCRHHRTTFSMPVSVIIQQRPLKHMPWVYTGRMIAGMQNANAANVFSKMQCINHAMREKLIVESITVWGVCALPLPTGLWRAFTKQAGNACSLLWRVIWNWSKLRFRHDGLLFSSLWQGRLSIHWDGSPTF